MTLPSDARWFDEAVDKTQQLIDGLFQVSRWLLGSDPRWNRKAWGQWLEQQANDLQQQVADLGQQQSEDEGRIRSLGDRIRILEQERDDYRRELDDCRQERDDYQRGRNAYRWERDNYQRELRESQAANTQLKDQVVELRRLSNQELNTRPYQWRPATPQTPGDQPLPPPPTPQMQQAQQPSNDAIVPVVVGRNVIRQWLKDMGLHHTCPLESAILEGDVDQVRRTISRDRTSGLKAPLHVAALTGDIDIARILIEKKRGIVNSTTATISRNRSNVPHVTPLHLAIGAQQHEMIRFLVANGASLIEGGAVKVKHASAPPRWVLAERWLGWMDGYTGVDGVIATLQTLQEVGWNVDARLCNEGKTMLDYAKDLPAGPTKTRVLEHLTQLRRSSRM